MDKIVTINIEQKSINYHNIKNGKRNLKININNIICPFGIDEEYGNYVFKLELDKENEKHMKVIEEIRELENKLKLQFNTDEEEWKSIINIRENNNIFIESKVKKIRNNIVTKLTFKDKDKNYLKTLYELKYLFTCDVILEINTLWDFRKKNEKENNKIGLILNLNSIHVH